MPETCAPNDCPVSARVDALKDEFDRYRENSSDTHRQTFDRIGALEQSGAAVRTRLDSIEEKLDELAVSVKALADKPAKRWDGIVGKAIWAVCAAVIAFLLAKIGLRKEYIR